MVFLRAIHRLSWARGNDDGSVFFAVPHFLSKWNPGEHSSRLGDNKLVELLAVYRPHEMTHLCAYCVLPFFTFLLCCASFSSLCSFYVHLFSEASLCSSLQYSSSICSVIHVTECIHTNEWNNPQPALFYITYMTPALNNTRRSYIIHLFSTAAYCAHCFKELDPVPACLSQACW